MISKSCILFAQTEVLEEARAVVLPICEPIKLSSRLAEELKLHLLELAYTEYEVTRRNLISEGFAHLSDAERYFLPCCSLHILEIYEYALSCLRSHVNLSSGILSHALESFKHQIKLPDACEITLAAGWALNALICDKALHLFVGPAVYYGLIIRILFLQIVLDELIRSVSGLAGSAVNKRIGESSYVSRCYPCLWVHQNSGIKAYVIGRFSDEFLSPRILDVILELNSERTEIPGVGQAAINLRTGEYVAPVLAKCDYLFHRDGAIRHRYIFFINCH